MRKDIIKLLIAVGVIGIILGAIVVVKTFYPLRYTEQVVSYAKKHHIDPYLALAVINTESRFNKNATSSQEAKGLMQITDSTAKEVNDKTNSTEEINEDSLYNVDVNVEIGCNYLQSLILIDFLNSSIYAFDQHKHLMVLLYPYYQMPSQILFLHSD